MRHRTFAIAAAAITAVIIGTSPAWLTGEWKKALGGLVVIALMAAAGWFGYAFGYGVAKADQIYREELDPRPEPETNDSDPFATQLRFEQGDTTTTTYDLTITNPNNTARTYPGLTIGQLADHLFHHDIRTYLAEADAATVTAPDGHQLTWQPSTDTTGETR